MTAGSILLGLALLLLVGLFLARPFFRREVQTTGRQTPRQKLLDQKEAVLTQIESLQFDFETGKIPEVVYQRQRTEMVAQAAAVLQQLDSLPQMSTVEAEIEAAIASLRKQTMRVPVAANGHGRYCSQCGTAVDAGDKFCTNCGQQLVASLPEAASTA